MARAPLFGMVVATYFFLVVGFAIMTTLFALFTERRFGYDARANGYLFGFIGIATVIVQGGLIGRLVKRYGERNLARAGLLFTAGSLALLPFCHTLPLLLVACLGLSLGTGLASPPLNGLASQMIDQSWQGRALGVMQSAGSVARLLGPLLGGSLLMLDLHRPIADYGRTPIPGRFRPVPHRCRARFLDQETARRRHARDHSRRLDRVKRCGFSRRSTCPGKLAGNLAPSILTSRAFAGPARSSSTSPSASSATSR